MSRGSTRQENKAGWRAFAPLPAAASLLGGLDDATPDPGLAIDRHINAARSLGVVPADPAALPTAMAAAVEAERPGVDLAATVPPPVPMMGCDVIAEAAVYGCERSGRRIMGIGSEIRLATPEQRGSRAFWEALAGRLEVQRATLDAVIKTARGEGVVAS
jgi:hypothetical protein